MITFTVAPYRAAQSGQLVYRRDEYSFATVAKANGRGISVVINEVQLFIDDENRVIYVSGYCPYQGWNQTALSPPTYSRANLMVVDFNATNIPTGMAFGLNDSASRWPVYVNPEGWVCIGDSFERGGQAIEFVPSCVAVLIDNRLVALWLHPIILEGK